MEQAKPQAKKFKSRKILKKSGKEILEESLKKNDAPEFVTMRSDTQPVRSIEEDDREGRINHALDMVAEDLKITQGPASAKNAIFTLTSPKMKEHVGRLCDEITRRRKECAVEKTPRSKSMVYDGLPLSSFLLSEDNSNVSSRVVLEPKPPVVGVGRSKSVVVRRLKPTQNRTTTKPKKYMLDQVISENSKSLGEIISAMGTDVPNSAIDVAKVNPQSEKEVPSPKTATKTKVVKKKNKKLNLENKIPTPLENTSPFINKLELYRTSVDLYGFANENISLDLNDRRLIIVAFRPKDKANHARKVTEIIDIPKNVDLDSLKIARLPNGSLLIEEVIPQIEDTTSLPTPTTN